MIDVDLLKMEFLIKMIKLIGIEIEFVKFDQTDQDSNNIQLKSELMTISTEYKRSSLYNPENAIFIFHEKCSNALPYS